MTCAGPGRNTTWIALLKFRLGTSLRCTSKDRLNLAPIPSRSKKKYTALMKSSPSFRFLFGILQRLLKTTAPKVQGTCHQVPLWFSTFEIIPVTARTGTGSFPGEEWNVRIEERLATKWTVAGTSSHTKSTWSHLDLLNRWQVKVPK